MSSSNKRFGTTPIETKEEAISTAPAKRTPVSKVRYRNVSPGYDLRDDFLEMGANLLPYIDEAISRKQLTPEFVQKRGMAMFCHGSAAAHMLDDSDDLQQFRAAKRRGVHISKRSQQKWLAHQILALMGEGLLEEFFAPEA